MSASDEVDYTQGTWCTLTDSYMSGGLAIGEWEIRDEKQNELGAFSICTGPHPEGTTEEMKRAALAIDIIECLDNQDFIPVASPTLFEGKTSVFQVYRVDSKSH